MQQAEVAQKLALQAPIAQIAGDDQGRLEVMPSLIETGQSVVDHSKITPHDALETLVPQVSSHRQRRLELFKSFVESTLHLVQQAEVASYVAFKLPIPKFLCQGKRGFVMGLGLVHSSGVGVKNAQVGKDAALTLAVPGLSGKCERLLELRLSFVDPTKYYFQDAEFVVSVALQRPILNFSCDDERRIEVRPPSVHAAPVTLAPGEADERPALAMPVSDLARMCQRRLELRVRLSVLAAGRERAARNPLRPGGCGGPKPGYGLHQRREFDTGAERPAQDQPCPGALKRVRCHISVGPRRSSATSDDEIVEVGTGIGNSRLLLEARKVRAVSCFGGEQRRRAAARVAIRCAQVLRCILLHAHEEVEAIVGHLPDERLLHQRLQHVHGPRRVVVCG